MIGTTLNHYRITGQLGKGGMGEVYRAKDQKLREVAINVLPEELAKDADRVARFQRETVKRVEETKRERNMANNKSHILLTVLCCLLFLGFLLEGSFAKDKKITARQLVSNHLKSLGTPDALSAIRTRSAVGTITYRFVSDSSGQASGQAQWASEKGKTGLVIKYNDGGYWGEHFVLDGKNIGIAETSPGHLSILGYALNTSYGKSFISNGMLGGVLSLGWPLLDIKGSKAKIKYHKKRIDGREFHELEYNKLGHPTYSVKMYFDLDTFRHVMTEYRLEGEGDWRGWRFVISEKFDNFKEVDGITIPFSYTLNYSGEKGTATFSFDISRFDHNLKIDPQFYKVKN